MNYVHPVFSSIDKGIYGVVSDGEMREFLIVIYVTTYKKAGPSMYV